MAKKKKRDGVLEEMEERLTANRSGKLTPGQWIDMIMQPIITVLVLLAPVSFLLLPRLALFLVRGGWLLALLLVLGMAGMLILRAYRYARTPVHYAELYTRDSGPPFWMFWRPLVLYDEYGNAVKFGKRLAPRPLLKPDTAYIVYYLEEVDDNVLLSIAPTEHPNVAEWQPDRLFEARYNRRASE